MTTLNNRQKNIAHEQRQAKKIRPAAPVYNFEELERVVRVWVTGTVIAKDEIYSPYLGAL